MNIKSEVSPVYESPLLSIVIPVFNEKENIQPLYEELKTELEKINKTYEIIFVDDGSNDGTKDELLKLNDITVKPIFIEKNSGISAALEKGFASSSGKLIISMDGDLQNDPRDIHRLLQEIDGYDAVVTWRRKRKDNFIRRVLSKTGNLLRNLIIGESIKDSSSTMRIYQSSVIKKIHLSNGMHRFIPTLLRIEGYKIKEVPINHRPRKCGKSKINLFKRILKTSRDVFIVRKLRKK
ncbi:MAG: glycosyltransferase family 2 protein [Candidatus Hydrogenedentota bacterium]